MINEEQAELVRRVFREYLEGKSYNSIAKGLTKDRIKTITGKEKWWDSTISGMLENEKYYGAALLQKTITVNFLTHIRTPNQGQSPKYMIDENHLPIIDKETFDKVQDEKVRRALLRGNLVSDRHKYSSKYPFSAKVFCGNCGNIYKRRQWNSTNTSKKVVWQCKTYILDGKDACGAKAVGEDVLMDGFVRMFNRIFENRDALIKTMTENIQTIFLQRPDIGETEILDHRIHAYTKRHGYTWNDEIKNYMKVETARDQEKVTVQYPKGRVGSILEMFNIGMDSREIARKLRFTSAMEMADFMRNNGYAWNCDANNYGFVPPEKEHVDEGEATISNGFISEFYAKYAEILNLLASNKEKLEGVINTYSNGVGKIPRYVIPGVMVTKSLHMPNSLDMMCKEFSERKNVSQKDIILVALVEFFRKYGFKDEVKRILKT